MNKWKALPKWTLQYTDGSLKEYHGVDGQLTGDAAGGIIHRNNEGVKLLMALNLGKQVQSVTPVHVEALAFMAGLKIAQHKGVENIFCLTDSRELKKILDVIQRRDQAQFTKIKKSKRSNL